MIRSLGFTLALSLAGLQLVAITIVIVSSYFSSERALLNHSRDMLRDVAAATKEHSQGFLAPAKGAAELARRLAENDIVTSDQPELLEKLLFQQLQAAPHLAGVYYGDAEGSFVYVMRSDGTAPFRTKIISRHGDAQKTDLIWRDQEFTIVKSETDPSDRFDHRARPWYTRAKAEKETIWTEPYIFFTSKSPGITVASPAVDGDGEVIGVIGVDIEIRAISDFLAKLNIGKNGRALILNHNGDVIAHPNLDIIRVAETDGTLRVVNISEVADPIARAAFADVLVGEEIAVAKETSTTFEHEGEAYVSTLTPTLQERLPWTIGVYAPEADFTQAIKDNRSRNILIALAVAAVTAFVGLALAHLIHRPVRELANRANRIARGQLEPTGPFPRTFRELDRAGLAFTRMSKSLVRVERERDQLTEDLRASHRSLEARVSDRTAELASVNAKLQAEIADKSAAQAAASKEAALHRQTAERLRVAIESATVANSAKSRFLSSMSHELRNPLNAIIGFSDILQIRREKLSDPERDEFLQYIKSSGVHLLALVDDILDLEKIEAGGMRLNMGPVDVSKILNELAIENRQTATLKNVRLNIGQNGLDLPMVYSDPVRLRQVLGNLVSNAIKYNLPGGAVDVIAERTGPYQRLIVADGGKGIPQDLHPRVFAPFDRLGAEASSVEGTGVGLALAKRLIESLGGRIGFASELGRGSRFWIDVPVLTSIDQRQVTGGKGTPVLPLQRSSMRRVLYIDDNDINLKLVENYLLALGGATFRTATTGALGLEKAKAEQFDLILVDINLPDTTGYDLLEDLRDLQPGSLIVAISADAMQEHVDRGLKAGFDAYITKPIDFGKIEQSFQHLFEGI